MVKREVICQNCKNEVSSVKILGGYLHARFWGWGRRSFASFNQGARRLTSIVGCHLAIVRMSGEVSVGYDF